MSTTKISLALARNAMPCDSCFAGSEVQRTGIGVPQPFTVGQKYMPGGTAVLSINPGATVDGGYKEARFHALTRFATGDDRALKEYWSALAEDAAKFWNPRYLARLNMLDLAVDKIAVGNIALCATAGNKYPPWLLQNCWSLHTAKMLSALQPGTVVFMGSDSVMSKFQLTATGLTGKPHTIRMAHFAHREGHAHELSECARVKAFLSNAA